jgi:multicomponent Na+:H+ antiporter subunit G
MVLVGNILIVVGGAFLVLGGLGLIRMPDVYNRLQAGTKATTLGAMSVVLGSAFLAPSMMTKAILLVIFIAMANPISSSTIARSAYKAGVPLAPQSVRDDWKQEEVSE